MATRSCPRRVSSCLIPRRRQTSFSITAALRPSTATALFDRQIASASNPTRLVLVRRGIARTPRAALAPQSSPRQGWTTPRRPWYPLTQGTIFVPQRARDCKGQAVRPRRRGADPGRISPWRSTLRSIRHRERPRYRPIAAAGHLGPPRCACSRAQAPPTNTALEPHHERRYHNSAVPRGQ